MAFFDLSPTELIGYRPDVAEPTAFDDFWTQTLSEARAVDTPVHLEPVVTGLELIRVDDVTFPGFAGDPIRAWLIRPVAADGPLPVVVEYLGYGGGRGLPHERLTWAAAGFAHLVMDTRGQGGTWGSGGHTPDPHGHGPSRPGFMTRGITDPFQHYYRRLVTDGVRAVDAVRTVPGIDPDRVAVTGVSQGGGLALAVAGLVPDLVAAMPDVPFLCHFRRAIEITDEFPYREITEYLSVNRDQEAAAFETLSYVDGVNFAKRAQAPALFSVALMDTTCPPSTVYAAYNRWAGSEREIDVYPFNRHEGGQEYRFIRQLAWLRKHGF